MRSSTSTTRDIKRTISSSTVADSTLHNAVEALFANSKRKISGEAAFRGHEPNAIAFQITSKTINDFFNKHGLESHPNHGRAYLNLDRLQQRLQGVGVETIEEHLPKQVMDKVIERSSFPRDSSDR